MSVCHSVHRGEDGSADPGGESPTYPRMQTPSRMKIPPPRCRPLHPPPPRYMGSSDTTRYGQQADVEHPTGMHSCLHFHSQLSSVMSVLEFCHISFYHQQTKFAKVMFSQVLFVHREVCLWSQTPPGQTHPPGQCMLGYTHPCPIHTPPAQCMLEYGQQVGSTHPTGMHSCFFIF